MKPNLLKRSQLLPGIQYVPIDSHGEPLIGTLETVPGVANASTVQIEDGKLNIDYDGETSMEWDNQVTRTRRGQRIWVDAGGEEIPENRIRFIIAE